MTLADFATTGRNVPFSLTTGFRAVVRWVAARHEARAKRAALQALLFAPEYRLRDLGISRDEIIAAIEASRK